MNKQKVDGLHVSLFNNLAFSKEENLTKTVVNFRRRQSTLPTCFANKFKNHTNELNVDTYNIGVNKKKEKLDKLLVKTEKVTKDLYLEEKKNKDLEGKLNE